MKGIPIGVTAPADPNAPWVSKDGFLFHPTSGLTYSLNPLGSLVLTMLKAGSGLTEILQTIVERFDIDAATARTDLSDFLGQIRAMGLHDMIGGQEQ